MHGGVTGTAREGLPMSINDYFNLGLNPEIEKRIADFQEAWITPE
jgi:hypothetical protein